MPREAKFNPTGKPRRRVRPSGSERNPNSPGVAPYGASDLRGATVPGLPSWANSFHPAGAVACVLLSDSRPPSATIAPSPPVSEGLGAQHEPCGNQIARYLRTSPQAWMNLQAEYDLRHAKKKAVILRLAKAANI